MELTSLLEPLAADAPCGPDLEYDAAFLGLERMLENAYVDRAVGPESEESTPDWRQIAERALALLDRSRDLRIATTLTKAWLNLHGISGLARGLSLVQKLATQHWQAVHPQLGVDGDHDGVMRVSALRSLCDARSVISAVRAAALVGAPALGEFCLRDLEKVHANGASAQSATPTVDAGAVEAAWNACSLERLEGTYAAVQTARADLAALENLFVEHGAAPLRLSELGSPLDSIHTLITPRIAARRAAAKPAEPAANGGASNGTHLSAHDTAQPLSRNADNALLTRADIARQLDRLCAWYQEHEPSSPVPLLLRRAKRLTTMQFVDIVRELAPGGMAEIDTLRGPNTTEES